MCGKDMMGAHNVRCGQIICLCDVFGDIHSPKHVTRAKEDGRGIANPGPQGPRANGYYSGNCNRNAGAPADLGNH